MTPGELDALQAKLARQVTIKMCREAADAIAALREQVAVAQAQESRTQKVLEETVERMGNSIIRLEADNAALRQELAAISKRIVNPLYDDPTERKGLATVIDAALLAGKKL